jgi:hypothetical protein
MGTARMSIHAEILRDILKLPEDCDLTSDRPTGLPDVVTVIVTHDSIPDDAEVVTATYAGNYGKFDFQSFRVVETR